MRELSVTPECLSRRYQAVDQLISELDTARAAKDSETSYPKQEKSNNDVGVKLMCDFWNILKQDPSCDLSKVVLQKMREQPSSSSCATTSRCSHPQSYKLYMSSEHRHPRKNPESNTKGENACGGSATSAGTACSAPEVPLTKVLCDLENAASYDKKCSKRLSELMKTEKRLQDQISALERKEKASANKMKEADCMWSCMEDAYKQQIAASTKRQQELNQQLKVIETSTTKWRKNKKDLESQLDSAEKQNAEINEKIHQKTNDIKSMKIEIKGLEKRKVDCQKATEAVKNSLSSKREASDERMAAYAKDIKEIQKDIAREQEVKQNKEDEANAYVKGAREDLQQICRVLLRKKLENEDLTAEKEEIINEIKMLEASLEGCKERCKKRQESIYADLEKINTEINNYKLKCSQCNQYTDTNDIRRFCTDCPKCLAERECLYTEPGFCDYNHSNDCVCHRVKKQFLDNIFENMATVLTKEVKTKAGKHVAEAVLRCLKHSTNGKLNSKTKDIVQEFVLNTVKKNLNLVIVGGGVKTRCELDPNTYKQLMSCLNAVAIPKGPVKTDKGTVKKESCDRWGGPQECFCPSGPKHCVCAHKAPPKTSDPTPCPPNKEDLEETDTVCPRKDTVKCGVDCGMRSFPDDGQDMGQWQQDPCYGSECPFSKTSKTAFMIGPGSYASIDKCKTVDSRLPNIPAFKERVKSKQSPELPCECRKSHKGTKQLKAVCPNTCDKNTGHEMFEYYKSENDNINVVKKEESKLYVMQENNTGTVKFIDDIKIPSVQKEMFDKEAKNDNIKALKSLDEQNKCGTYQDNNTNTVKHVDDMKIPSVQKEIFEKVLIDSGTELYAEVPTFDDPKKIDVVSNNKGTDAFEVKTKTGSISLTDDLILKYLYKEMGQPNCVCASLNETNSGHVLLNLAADPTDSTANKMKVNTSRSGKISIESDKKCLQGNKRKSDLKSDEGKEPHKSLNDKQVVDDRLGKKCNHSHGRQHIQQILEGMLKDIFYESYKDKTSCANFENVCTERKSYEKAENINQSNYDQAISIYEELMKVFPNDNQINSYTTISLDFYKNELLQIHECRPGDLKIKVNGKNGAISNMNATITKTQSGQVALYLKNFTSFGEISNKDRENPIFLRRTASGKYAIFIGQWEKAPNTVLRRTSSGGALVVITEPVLKSMALDKKLYRTMSENQAFEVNIKGVSDKIVHPPAILKLTSSGNYLLVLDKEFQKEHEETINKSLSKNSECFVELEKISPIKLLINFDVDRNSVDLKNHAVLAKSSENIKILINGPIFDSLGTKINKSYNRNAFSELLSKLSTSKTVRKSYLNKEFTNFLIKPFDNERQKKRIVDIKSSSDSQMYETVRLRLIQREGLWAAPSAMLKKSSSGQFALVLDKDTKNTFIKGVKDYLKNNSQAIIPVNRTDSGEITINMTGENKGETPYERLKITTSGNIYIVVDENTLKTMESAMNTEYSPRRSNNKESKKPSVEDKSVSTFCNAKPDECCLSDKCMCSELQESWQYDPHYPMFIPKQTIQSVKGLRNINFKAKDCDRGCDPKLCQGECVKTRKKNALYVPNMQPVHEAISSASSAVSNPNGSAKKISSPVEQCFHNVIEKQNPYVYKSNDAETSSTPMSSIQNSFKCRRPVISEDDQCNTDKTVDDKYKQKSSLFLMELQLPYFLRN